MKKRKFTFRTMGLILALLVGVSMLGTGIAAAAGVFSVSGTVNVSVTAGTISIDTSTQGWVKGQGNVWSVSVVQGSSSTAVFTITNTYGDTQTVNLGTSVSPDSELTAQWDTPSVSVAGNSGTQTASLTVTASDIASASYTVTISAHNP